MIKLIKNTYFILYFFSLLSFQTIQYFLFGDYEKRCKNIINYLASKNLLYVKVFQALSANTDLITPEFSSYLMDFTDNVPFNLNDIEINNILEDIEEIGKTWPELKISNIDSVPYKSGTISVVYNAKMNKKNVVIKVLRKNIDKRMKEALEQAKIIIYFLSKIKIIKDLHLNMILHENTNILLDQVDFLKEIFNIDMFERSNKNRESYIIPHVYNEFTIKNKRMIVMDKLDGIRLDKLKEEEKNEYILLITKFLIISIIFDGHYHGDLHPGNILFMRDKNNTPKIGIIDYGIVGKLLPKVQEDLHYFFLALLQKDYIKVGESILDSLIVTSDINSNINKQCIINNEIREELIKSFSIIAEEAVRDEGNIGPDEVIKINKILEKYNLKLSHDFCKIILSMGVSKCLCETLCVGNKKYVEYINEATNELMSDALNILDV